MTGHGCVYFAEAMLNTRGRSLVGLRVAVSGSGMVAQYAIEKCIQLGARLTFLPFSSASPFADFWHITDLQPGRGKRATGHVSWGMGHFSGALSVGDPPGMPLRVGWLFDSIDTASQCEWLSVMRGRDLPGRRLTPPSTNQLFPREVDRRKDGSGCR